MDLNTIYRCPVCHRNYAYDNHMAWIDGTTEHEITDGDRTITLHLCPDDGGVVGVQVMDDTGGFWYMPDEREV